jgi:hypothetical protein
MGRSNCFLRRFDDGGRLRCRGNGLGRGLDKGIGRTGRLGWSGGLGLIDAAGT